VKSKKQCLEFFELLNTYRNTKLTSNNQVFEMEGTYSWC